MFALLLWGSLLPLGSALCSFGAEQFFAVNGAGGNGPSALYLLDSSSGELVQKIGNIGTPYNHTIGIAIHPDTDMIFAVNTGANESTLLALDTSIGIGTVIGTTGYIISDLAFSPAGVLYGWAESAANGTAIDTLAEINTITGAATLALPAHIVNSSSTGLAVDQNGLFYVKTNSTLYQFDPTDGRIIDTVALANSTDGFLAVDVKNQLYTAHRQGGVEPTIVYRLSRTGEFTELASVPIARLSAFDFRCEDTHFTPLSTVALLFFASMLMICALWSLIMSRRGDKRSYTVMSKRWEVT